MTKLLHNYTTLNIMHKHNSIHQEAEPNRINYQRTIKNGSVDRKDASQSNFLSSEAFVTLTSNDLTYNETPN